MTIELYGKPDEDCMACKQTSKRFDAGNVTYTKYDVTQDEKALAYVKELNYLSAPVVVIKDETGNIIDHWGGLRPDKIRDITSQFAVA